MEPTIAESSLNWTVFYFDFDVVFQNIIIVKCFNFFCDIWVCIQEPPIAVK